MLALSSPLPRSQTAPERPEGSRPYSLPRASAVRPVRRSRLACIVSAVSIVCIALTLVICEVVFNFAHDAFLNTVVPDNLTFPELPSTPMVQHAPLNSLLESLPLADGTLLWSFLSDEPVPNITANIYCLYDPVKANREVVYRLSNIPLSFCTAVVFCCAGISSLNFSLHFYKDDGEEHDTPPTFTYFTEFLSLKLYRKANFKLFVAIGGPPKRYRNLAESMPASSEVMRGLYRDIIDLGLDGIVLYVLQPGLFPLPHLLNSFILSHRGYRYHVLVFLPGNLHEHAKYFDVASLLEDEFVQVIQISHPLVTESDYVTCPSPKWGPNNPPTMKTIQEELQRQYVTVWDKLQGRLLFTVSLLGYSFMAQKSASGRDVAIMLDDVTYTEACAAVRSRRWTEKFDPETDCFVASKEGLFMATPGTKSFSFLEESTSLAGVFVFDLYSDDYRGICGINHPLSKAIHSAFANRTVKEMVEVNSSSSTTKKTHG